MKKFTLFAALMMTAGAMAQTYTFTNKSEDYKIVDNCEATTYKMDEVEGFSLNYVTAEEKMHFTLAANENVTFEYSNSAVKDNIVKTGPDYMQLDGKNVVIVVSKLKAGDHVSIVYTAKSDSKSAVMTNAGNENTEPVVETGEESKNKADKQTYEVVAQNDGSVKIKETSNGYRLYSLTITAAGSEATAVDAVEAEDDCNSAKKVVKNGKILLEKNGVLYDLNGVVVK